MAAPRVFLSSTCYDLQEIRSQLKAFIESMGYEPVMSECGDIFYDLRKHVQDSCRDEVARCNMFVLVIGNSYGSIYHQHVGTANIPDSVTLQEFRKALDIGIPKYIFVNRLVQHDYDNYRRALEKKYSEHFEKENVPDNRIAETKQNLRQEFDKQYHFPQEPYVYVFHFLDLIYLLKYNNAILPFESFEEIKEMLKKQWAGLVYDILDKQKHVPIGIIEQLGKKLENIERQIRVFAESKSMESSNSKVATFNLDELSKEFVRADIQELKERIAGIIDSILFEDNYGNRRVTFREKWDSSSAKKWIESLGDLTEKFKWSTSISVVDLYKGFTGPYRYSVPFADVPYDDIRQLSTIAENISDSEREKLANTVATKFNKCYEPPPPPDDDVPF